MFSTYIYTYIGKHIMNQEIIRNGHSDGEVSMSQEKQIEVLMTHIRRLNSTLGECRKKERLTAETNEGAQYELLNLNITTCKHLYEIVSFGVYYYRTSSSSYYYYYMTI